MVSVPCGFAISSIIIFFLLLLPTSYSEKAPYETFAKDARTAPPEAYYDYIIVGGGTSGCALAATLSQGAKVLLLERGGLPYDFPSINNIAGFPLTLANILPSSPSQLFISTDGVINHRGRVLGGGSALNAGFFTRAQPEFVARSGWDPELVEESYEWVEKKVAFEPEVKQWQSAVRDGLLEAGVLPNNGFTFDHINGTKVGGSIFDKNGHRHTAADLLEYADPSKITLHLHATAQRILFETLGKAITRAKGVEYKDAEDRKHTAYLNVGSKNEVIVSAGALGSPQLLMLSGIGPLKHLQEMGIEVLLDQPMVGQGMADNPMNALIIPTTVPLEISLIQTVGITDFGSYIEAASGTIQLGWAHKLPQSFFTKAKLGFEMKAQEQGDTPEMKSRIEALLNPSVQAGIILEKIVGPLSSGHLELETLDPSDNPKVTFNYFQHPQDLQRCVKGMETVIKVLQSEPVSKLRLPFATVPGYLAAMVALPINLRPKHFDSVFSLQQFCKDTVMTIWHYHGGCQVNKVVDQDYRVLGVDALRVIDGSTFSFDSPGTNPQATVMMMGRYMGQRILQERSGRK